MIRSEAFLRAYKVFPHRAINRAAASIARLRRPAWLVSRAVTWWVHKDRIDMSDFESPHFESLEHFFLRRLRPGSRPLSGGLMSPVDGCVVGVGALGQGTMLQVKGSSLSIDRLINGRGLHDLPGGALSGGRYMTLFLRPRGYHFVHAPLDGTLVDARWIPGRFFPQNEDALLHIPRIYERNERVVLRLRPHDLNADMLLVMVGASVIGGIHVKGVEYLRKPGAISIGRPVAKGEEIGHFSFGSTVVLLLPEGMIGEPLVSLGQEMLLGQALAPLPGLP